MHLYDYQKDISYKYIYIYLFLYYNTIYYLLTLFLFYILDNRDNIIKCPEKQEQQEQREHPKKFV
jgi:hypothetical protein